MKEVLHYIDLWRKFVVCAVFLSHSIVIKRKVWLVNKSGSTNMFFFNFIYQVTKMAAIYITVRFNTCWFFFCCTSTFLKFLCFPHIIDVFPWVSICSLDLSLLNRLITFEHQYTTIAFINAVIRFQWKFTLTINLLKQSTNRK